MGKNTSYSLARVSPWIVRHSVEYQATTQILVITNILVGVQDRSHPNLHIVLVSTRSLWNTPYCNNPSTQKDLSYRNEG